MLFLPRRALLPSLVAALAVACGGGDSSSSQQLPAGTITGRERLGWSQQAPDDGELRSYTYVIYVDDKPVELAGVSCGALTGPGPAAECSSPLPSLTTGQHKLELATRVIRDGEVVESVRSAPLGVTVAGVAAIGVTSAASAARPAPAGELRFSGSGAYVVEPVVSGLNQTTALVELPDRRLLVAERGGRVRIADGGRLTDEPALELADAAGGEGAGVGLAVAQDFAATRHVYVSYTARREAGDTAGRVARYREVGGTLGERVVILDGLPAATGAPRVALGSDGRIYVATGASSTAEAGSLATFAGKILSLTAAGATPDGNPIRASPVLSAGYRARVELGWASSPGGLWYAENRASGAVVGRVRRGEAGEPLVQLAGARAESVAFYRASAPAAWAGSLFLASSADESLYRVSGLQESPPKPAVEQLFPGRFGPIVALAAGPDGLYFAAEDRQGSASGEASHVVYLLRGAATPRQAR